MHKNLWLAEIWDEWLSSDVKYPDFEASGLLMGMKNFKTNRLRTARRLTSKIWPLTSYSKTFQLGISMLTSPSHKPSVKFSCPPEILKLPKSSRSIWAWLKGLWGSIGGLYFPKSGYYLTLIISDKNFANITRNILAHTNLSWSEHRNEFTLRNHDDVTTFLYKIGITSGALDFENQVLIKSARNKANLASNYDTANITRSIKAAREQIIMAKKILAGGMLESLPEKLYEVVMLRLKFPDYTLDELGKNLNPPVKKSTVKYRWQKLKNFIDNMTLNNEEKSY